MFIHRKVLQLIKMAFYLSLFLSLTQTAYAQEFHLSNEFSFTYNNVTGPGSASSSLTEGWHYLNILNIYGTGKIKEFDYNLNLGTKSTDDRRNDPKTHSLTNLQLRLTNKIHTFNLGDTFESFSQYSLSTALKGASYKYYDESMKLPEITLIYGLAYPRWDNVWREDKTKTIERQVYGSRLKYNFSEEFWAGISVVRSVDDKRVWDTDALYKNIIYSLDMEYKPLPGLTLSSELAFNNTKVSPQEGAAYNESSGYAFKMTAVGDKDPSKVTLEYERVTPDFVTLLGSATPDREKFKIKWRYKHSKTLSLNTGFLWYRNNLEGQRTDGRTDYYKPEIGITLKKLFGREYSIADISYKLSISERNSDTTKTDHIVTLNYRDRFGVFDSDTNLSYTSYDTKDSTRARSKEYLYNTSLSSRHTVGDFILSPSVYLGGWTSRNELENQSDIIYEYSLGLGVDIPKWKINSNIKIGQNKLEKDKGDDSQKTFANLNIYYRPKFLEKMKQGMIFIRAYVNDFRYTTGSNNFRETSITTGLTIEL